MLTSICLWSEARLKPRSVKGEGEGVGTNEREGVVQISVGLPLPPGLTCPDLELPSMVELRRCFCIWSDISVGTVRENESSSLLSESLLSVSRTEQFGNFYLQRSDPTNLEITAMIWSAMMRL